MAGPESPPVLLARWGFLVFKSIDIPTKVLHTDKASAPAFSAALASKVISVTLGDNLTIRNFPVALRTEETTSVKTSGSELNC